MSTLGAGMSLAMLADFAVRLAWGMAAMLLVVPWRIVPPAFFRTHCQVILCLLVLAVLAQERWGGGPLSYALGVGAALSALAMIGWGLGLVRLALPLTAAVVASTLGAMAWASWGESSFAFSSLVLTARLSSALLLGSTLTAMLLGHHYLTAPSMTIDPLFRQVQIMAWALGVRTVLAALGLAILMMGGPDQTEGGRGMVLFLGMRWGMGIAGPALATYLAWRTVQIRSTQSATGILYIGMTLVLFGELTAMVLARDLNGVF
ncbi:MAG: hypothetical protein ABI353_05265 [Isosphaeraceae bacterium]